jgi:RecA/RadA recombinase
MSSAAFITGFTPPDYLIDGILQRRFIYAFTGRTGEGKTSVCLRLAAHVSEGKPLGEQLELTGRLAAPIFRCVPARPCRGMAGPRQDWTMAVTERKVEKHDDQSNMIDLKNK